MQPEIQPQRTQRVVVGLVAILLFCLVKTTITMSAPSFETIYRAGQDAHAERIHRLYKELYDTSSRASHPAFGKQAASHAATDYASNFDPKWLIPTWDWLWLVPIILLSSSLVAAVREWFNEDAEGRWFAAKCERALQHGLAAPINIVAYTVLGLCIVIMVILTVICRVAAAILALVLMPFKAAYNFLVQPSVNHVTVARVRFVVPDDSIDLIDLHVEESELTKKLRGFCWLLIIGFGVYSAHILWTGQDAGPKIDGKPVGIKTWADSLQWSEPCGEKESYGCWNGVRLHKYDMNNPSVGRVWPSSRRTPYMGKPLPTVTEVKRITDTATETELVTATEQHTTTETEHVHVAITHTVTNIERQTVTEKQYATHTVTETFTKDNFETLWEQAIPLTFTETAYVTVDRPSEIGPTFTATTVTEIEEVVQKEIEQITFTKTETITDTTIEPPRTVTATETETLINTVTAVLEAHETDNDSWGTRVNQPYWCRQKIEAAALGWWLYTLFKLTTKKYHRAYTTTVNHVRTTQAMFAPPPTTSLTKGELAARRAQARLAIQSSIKANTDPPSAKTRLASDQSPPIADSASDGSGQSRKSPTTQLDTLQSTLRRKIGFKGLSKDKISLRPEISAPISDVPIKNKPLPVRPPESPGERASHAHRPAPAAPRAAPSRPPRPAQGLSFGSAPTTASQQQSFNSLQGWSGFGQPVKRRLHFRDGSTVTVSSPPRVDLWTQRVYLPGPIRLQKLDLVSRKGSLASLEPFQIMLDDALQVATSRRESEDAMVNDICSFFEDLDTSNVFRASEISQWNDLSDSDGTVMDVDSDRFMTPPDSPLMELRQEHPFTPLETEEMLRNRGIASVRRSRDLEEQRKAALADNGSDKAVEAGLKNDTQAPTGEVTSSTAAAAGTKTSMPYTAVHSRRELLSSQESSAPWIQSTRDRAASKLKRYSQ